MNVVEVEVYASTVVVVFDQIPTDEQVKSLREYLENFTGGPGEETV